MITTKMIQIDYKKIIVVKNSNKNEFVAVLYRFCSSGKKLIISNLQWNYYKTTKIRSFASFFPQLQIQRHQRLDNNQWKQKPSIYHQLHSHN